MDLEPIIHKATIPALKMLSPAGTIIEFSKGHFTILLGQLFLHEGNRTVQ